MSTDNVVSAHSLIVLPLGVTDFVSYSVCFAFIY